MFSKMSNEPKINSAEEKMAKSPSGQEQAPEEKTNEPGDSIYYCKVPTLKNPLYSEAVHQAFKIGTLTKAEAEAYVKANADKAKPLFEQTAYLQMGTQLVPHVWWTYWEMAKQSNKSSKVALKPIPCLVPLDYMRQMMEEEDEKEIVKEGEQAQSMDFSGPASKEEAFVPLTPIQTKTEGFFDY